MGDAQFRVEVCLPPAPHAAPTSCEPMVAAARRSADGAVTRGGNSLEIVFAMVAPPAAATVPTRPKRAGPGERVMRVGGSTKISVDARLVCATLRPLDQEVQADRFRPDLYYRIQGVTLQVPALRDRHADIAPLVHQFVAELSARHSVKPPKVTRAVMAALRSYAWPGNVRELRNVIELVCLLRPGKQLRVLDLPAALRQPAGPSGHVDVRALSGERIEVSLDQKLTEILNQVMQAALDLEGGNRSRAARRLGLSLRTVQRHLARVP